MPIGSAEIGDVPTPYATYSVVRLTDMIISDQDAQPKRLSFRTNGRPYPYGEPVILTFNLLNRREDIVVRFQLNGVRQQERFGAAEQRALQVIFPNAIRPKRNNIILESESGSGIFGQIVAWYQVF